MSDDCPNCGAQMKQRVDRHGYKYQECPTCTGWKRVGDETVRGFQKYDEARQEAKENE